MTLAGALRDAAARLAVAGCETPRLDAELLLGHVLGVDRSRLVTAARQELEPAELSEFESLVARRAAREPVAYIVGVKDFRHLSLMVDRRVLIPRPETELLVEVGVTLAPGSAVADVGTGSGAIALALKDERPDLELVATEVDDDALAVARANAAALSLDVRLVSADLLVDVIGPFDAVLANLPYVATAADQLPPEVAYEPRCALFAGPDGLDLLRRLIGMAGGVPMVGLEVGFDQAGTVEQLMRDAGFASVQRLRDLTGHERVLVGRR